MHLAKHGASGPSLAAAHTTRNMASSEPAGATTQPAAEPDFADFSGFEGAIDAPADDEFADFFVAPPAEPEAPATTAPPEPTTPAATPTQSAAAAAPPPPPPPPPRRRGAGSPPRRPAATAELTSVQKRAAETLATPSMPSLSGLGDMLSPVNVGKNISATLDQAEKQLSTATSSMKEQISTATSSIVPPSLAKLPSLNSVGLPVASLPTMSMPTMSMFGGAGGGAADEPAADGSPPRRRRRPKRCRRRRRRSLTR